MATDLGALEDRDLVVEAITEDERAETVLFGKPDRIVSTPDAILASNTSSIPIMKLGVATQRPEHVVGIHFFNPVPVLPLVELVPSLLTAPDTVRRSRAFVEDQLGKQAIDCQDRAGFVVNALLTPFILSAIRMCESGFAPPRGHRPRTRPRGGAPTGPAGARGPHWVGHDEGRGRLALRRVQGAALRGAAAASADGGRRPPRT